MAPHHNDTAKAGQRPRPPLAVWPCAQEAGIAPQAALTRRLITDLSAPGDTIAALCHGEGTPLVQAAVMGRRAHGIEAHPQRFRAAQRRLRDHLPAARRREVVHWQADARTADVLLAPIRGRTRLVLLRLPRPGRYTDTPEETTHSAHLGRLTGAAYADAVHALITAAASLLRPGGHLAAICPGHEQTGGQVDRVTVCAHAAHATGLVYVQHIIALTRPISSDAAEQAEEGDGLPRDALGSTQAEAVTTLIAPCHDDVVLLHKPAAEPAKAVGR